MRVGLPLLAAAAAAGSPPTALFLAPPGTPGAHSVPGANYTVAVRAAGDPAPEGWAPFPTAGAPPGAEKYLVGHHTCGVKVNCGSLREAGAAVWPLPDTAHAVVAAAADPASVVSADSGRAPARLITPPRAANRTAPAPVGKVPRRVKEALMDTITNDEAEKLLRGLSGADPIRTQQEGEFTIQTRMSTSADNLRSANWIGEWLLANAGCDDLLQQEFRVSGSTTRNVICVKRGTIRSDEVVVVGAHFDSIPSSGSAPGAVDNGSGSVSVMMIAKALLQHAFECTIHFIVFSGEEQGLIGSRHYVDEALRQNQKIPVSLIMDMTAYSNRYFGVIFEGTNDPAIVAVMDNAQDNLDLLKSTLGSQMTTQHEYRSFGSDHVPFQQAGIPSILHIEQDCTSYPGYHRSSDQVNYANWSLMRDIARVVLAQVLDYAALVQ